MKFLGKSKFSILMLTILALGILSNTIMLAQADNQGIGKYLTINITGEGYVTATKIKSGEVFLFNSTKTQHKVGAGTVLLETFPSDGWEFAEWAGEYLTGTEDSLFFKTEKYATITAIFREETYTITASSSLGGSITPSGNVQVTKGANQTFQLSANSTYHISSIIVDGSYSTSYAENYTFYNVLADHTIHVIFSENGKATVPAGIVVTVFLGEGAGITFPNTTGGEAAGESVDFPEGSSVIVWELNYTATFYGGAHIALSYNDTGLTLAQELNLRLISGESLEELYSDVNGDLVVDGTDLSIIANAVNTNQQPDWYVSYLDIDNDGFVDKDDIHIVNSYKGTILEDVTDYVDPELNIIYGITSHFSLFRCR